jgi:hypothetical protein
METEYVQFLMYLICLRILVMHLLIEFSNKKHAKFEHFQAAFNLDQQIRTYTSIYLN